MPNLALVTGASSGIGRELALRHTKSRGDLIITARREDQLDALKREIEADENVTVHVIPHDLGEPGGADALCDKLDELGLAPDILINNAGFGGHGAHLDRDLADEQAMIDLNIKALVTLCHRIGGQMARRGSGKILNVGSSAGFMPGPNQAVYFATKAFVNSFSQALDQELRDTGVTVTVLTPGYVETEFASRANLTGTGLTKQKGATAKQTAKIGYEAMLEGKLVAFNEAKIGFASNWLLPFAPRRMLLKQIQRMQSK